MKVLKSRYHVIEECNQKCKTFPLVLSKSHCKKDAIVYLTIEIVGDLSQRLTSDDIKESSEFHTSTVVGQSCLIIFTETTNITKHKHSLLSSSSIDVCMSCNSFDLAQCFVQYVDASIYINENDRCDDLQVSTLKRTHHFSVIYFHELLIRTNHNLKSI